MSRMLLLAAAGLALAACRPEGEDPRIQAPPARWTGGPAGAVLQLRDIEAVDRDCRALGVEAGDGQRVDGCFDSATRLMILPLPAEMGAVRFRQLVEHEAAHARGWPAGHPKG